VDGASIDFHVIKIVADVKSNKVPEFWAVVKYYEKEKL
jgi:hypothetical protein